MESSVLPTFRTWHIVRVAHTHAMRTGEISQSEVGIKQTYEEAREMCFSRSQDGKDTLYWLHAVFSTQLP